MDVKKRRVVYWGTGEISTNLSLEKVLPEAECYIDNSIEKRGKDLLGKSILHPLDIQDWKCWYIVIATDYYIEIANQLVSYGLTEREDFIYYKDFFDDASTEGLIDEVINSIKSLEGKYKEFQNKILIFADFVSYDKGICHFVNQWDKLLGQHKLLLFSEATWLSMEQTKKKIGIDCFILPKMFGKNYYPKKEPQKDIRENYEEECLDIDYMCYAARNLRMRHADMQQGYEYLFCHYAVFFIEAVLQQFHPKEVVVWNAFHAFHHIICNLCEKYQVKIIYMEFGNIPGTIFMEKVGQMGESLPARYPETFLQIQVTKEELCKAARIRDHLRNTGLNRNTQPEESIEEDMNRKIKKGRPVIFYAGQNDFESGLQPYNENARQFHSPVFKSSLEAAIALAGICDKNDWNFIYKPHPIMDMFSEKKDRILPKSAIVIYKANINELIDFSDVTITILSTVCYTSLIRGKATLMLGYTQLKDKGCTYQAFQMNQIESTLKLALRSGFTQTQETAFIKHISQLLKYNSYYDLKERDLIYGKSLEKQEMEKSY